MTILSYQLVIFCINEAAAFVDVIHSDRTFGGTAYKVGHVDFWPNNAANPQPGCPIPVSVGLIDQLNGKIPLQSNEKF